MSRSSSSSPLRSPLDARLRQADLHDLFERQRSEEHTSELQSRLHLVCRLLLEKNKLFAGFERQGSMTVCASHSDRLNSPPPGVRRTASSVNTPISPIQHAAQHIVSVLLHPAVG